MSIRVGALGAVAKTPKSLLGWDGNPRKFSEWLDLSVVIVGDDIEESTGYLWVHVVTQSSVWNNNKNNNDSNNIKLSQNIFRTASKWQ